MRIRIFIILLVSFSGVINTQPATEWIRTYGNGAGEHFYDIYTVSDEGYVMCGRNPEGRGLHNENSDFYIVRIDNNGNLVWESSFGVEDQGDYANTIIETDDGFFLSVGFTGYPPREANEVAAVLISRDGEQLWWNTYARGTCYAVIELKGGEFILAGGSNRNGYLLCINSDGDVIWEETYDGGDNESFRTMRETEGGIVLAGKSGLQV